MVIYYWKLQSPNKLIFKMISGGNLLLETPDSRQTNFQYDQRVRKCWWHQWFNTLVRKRETFLCAFCLSCVTLKQPLPYWQQWYLYSNNCLLQQCHFFPNPMHKPFILKPAWTGNYFLAFSIKFKNKKVMKK